MNVVNAKRTEILKLLDNALGRAQTHRVLIGDMLDAVLATGRAAAACHNKGEGTLDHGHALLVERQQLMARDGHVVQIGDEGAIRIDDDFGGFARCARCRPAPRQPGNGCER